MTIEIDAKLPHTGSAAVTYGVARATRELEAAGFDSLWVSDHVVFPEGRESFYPFVADGKATCPSDTPYLEAVMAPATAAAVTEQVHLGTAALAIPQRNPVLLAEQAASLVILSDGRLRLGVGAGWLREEFDALNTSTGRGPRMVEWIDPLRDCWTGRPAARDGENCSLTAGAVMMPAPEHLVPLYIAGPSSAALDRAGRIGDGWMAQQAGPALDPELLAAEIRAARTGAEQAGCMPADVRPVVRLVESSERAAEIAPQLAALGRAGVDEIIVETPYLDTDPAAEYELLRDAAAA